MKTFVLLAVFVTVQSKVLPGDKACEVSDWGPWSPWRFPNHDSTASFPVTESGHDSSPGALRRKEMMKKKAEQAAIRRKCKEDGLCPQYKSNTIEGPVECVGGVAPSLVEEWECMLIDQQSFVPIDNMAYDSSFDSNPEMNDIWGWTDNTTNDEYAIAGLTSGTSFIRVTDPQNPVVLGHLTSRSGNSGTTWRDMKVIGDYVFIVSEHSSHGMQVFDLTKLRGLQGTPPVLFEEDASYSQVGSCHNIIANEDTGFVYLVGCDLCSGLHIVDVNNPLQPTYVTCFNDDGYVHDAQCVVYHGPHTSHQNEEICFCFNENTFTIVNVDDKTNIRILSRTGYSGVGYTHQGWVSDDHKLILLDDELDEYYDSSNQKTYIWDIFNLELPTMVNRYTAEETSADHNQYIIGDLTYQANYEMGLRILHIDSTNFLLTELAYFDVYPGFNAAEFNGAWSVYPFFKSGNLIVSSIQYGMFVLKPDSAAISKRIEKIHESEKRKERTRFRDVIFADDVTKCPDLQDWEYEIVDEPC